MKVSLLNKNWNILCEEQSLDLRKKLLKNRQIEDETTFFADECVFHDPFLLKDMDKAVARLQAAIAKKEKIVIFGDYDVDGISGAAILIQTLRHLKALVSYRLPHRVKDGYGLQLHSIDELSQVGVDLVVTVDNGIACKEQIDRAKSLGIDVIITDHHTIPEIFPDQAVAVVHPGQADCTYPFKDLAGAGVAFKLAKALLLKELAEDEAMDFIADLYDLAALGTVADCTSLTGENRFIVKRGLEQLHQSRWRGLSLLKKSAGIPDVNSQSPKAALYNADYIGFQIGPRINAAGRVDDPYYALQALLDEGGQAEQLVARLEQLNQERRDITQRALDELELTLSSDLEEEVICVAHNTKWPSGIVGLIAGRVAENYGKPAFIMEDRGETLVGSARCPEYFNVFEAIDGAAQYLDKYGGHKQAAGFSLQKSNLEGFTQSLKTHAMKQLAGKDLRAVLQVDTVLDIAKINFDTIDLIESFAPFGIGNAKPIFLIKDIQVSNLKTMGAERRHLSFDVKITDGSLVRAVAFNLGALYRDLIDKTSLDLVFSLERNSWQGRESLQLRVIDLA